ncbi:Uncharacterised protein [BD1-7 clade bacterium]|uniref:Tetrahaem cytochrome domain-containing protein n=1 Tax=BD1-7 clade bacterium TaxID=2029982 RepID=A0A5S9QSW4_9GAMM|nr:Uncharacterised protein [BD1-7 clade bacterium]
MVDGDKSAFLVGEASHGHHQIELSCATCHTEPFGGTEVLQDACTQCHQDELESAHDSHPRKKFSDPRNADLLNVLDARYCVSCHSEHQKDDTLPMGVTVSDDYCFHCHQDIADERESHQDLDYMSCGSAGCHNYHDNRALYEGFLTKHAQEPWLDDIARIGQANYASGHASKSREQDQKAEQEEGAVESKAFHAENPTQHAQWSQSVHEVAGVDCLDCHRDQQTSDGWITEPPMTVCSDCHQNESETYQQGKHGMRLAQGLSAITPSMARHEFVEGSGDLNHSCSSCHDSHDQNTQVAAVEACVGCHADEHSTNFVDSPHGHQWQQFQDGLIDAEQAVSCATCHMPRMTVDNLHAGFALKEWQENDDASAEAIEQSVFVNHNQNDNLRPNEKMLRSVCMNCHGLPFAIDALADDALIQRNFTGQPEAHVESVDWALDRLKPNKAE